VALGCMAEIEHCRMIVGSGTSADVQLAVFEAHKNGDGNGDGNNGAHALSAVTDWIATATLQ
jgi:glutamate---cysteine ligase / carboxylate-amine ligase